MKEKIVQNALAVAAASLVTITSNRYMEYLLFAFLAAIVAATKFTDFDDKMLVEFKAMYKNHDKKGKEEA